MSGTPEETSGIARLTRALRVDLKTGDINIWDRDIPRSFTTRWLTLNGATLATLATVGASAQGVAYGLYITNDGATTATVTIWEGTASTKKFHTNALAGDYFPYPDNPNPQAPVLKWQGIKALKARATGSVGARRISVGIWFWTEEP